MASPGAQDRENIEEPARTLDHVTLQRRARLGVFLLGGRTVLQQMIALGGTVYLARVLGPDEFGAFWIVQFVLSFFTLFGDAGFGAALIQKKNEASDEELSSVFWAQLGLGVLTVGVVYVTAPLVVLLWHGLPKSGVWMLRALSLGLLLTSARVIPTILMERELLFGRLSVIDLAITAGFNGAAVALAYLGFGTYALVGGVLAQGVAGLATAYVLRPWWPSLRMNFERLRPILRFGLTFQAKNMVGFVNAAVMPLYAGVALGPYALGIVTWSQNTAFFPLQIVAILARVNFPLLSRMQHEREAVVANLNRTVRVCATFSLLFVALFVGLGPSIVHVIYGDKWLPALPTLYVFAVVISIGFIVPVMGATLDALGQPQIMMRLGIYWTTLNWIAVAIVTHFHPSALGFALAYCIHIVVGNFAVLYAVKQVLPETRLWARVQPGIVAGLAVGVLARFTLLPWASGALSLGSAAVVTLAAFAGCLALIDRQGFLELVAAVRNTRPADPATQALR